MISNPSHFLLWDYHNSLFPLKLNHSMVEKYSTQIETFITKHKSFLPQHRVFASKKGWLLRRTVKLDPVAEYFLYDIVYKNRSLFTRQDKSTREVHGFRISNGEPISTLKSYTEYKTSVSVNRLKYRYYGYFDIATYFNHIYHHDLVEWFEESGASQPDVLLLGAFLREIAGGRSIDCLPQGVYPSKMIGSAFLSFLESSNRIRSKHTVRLMDDTWLFDDSEKTVISDFLQVQALLSERGLSVNDGKSKMVTEFDGSFQMPADIDEMKIDLLRKRRERLKEEDGYGESWKEDDDDDVREEDQEDLGHLAQDEQDYLLSLLNRPNLQEEDAELVLTLMKDHSSDVMEFLPKLIRNFPGLAKKLYYFCKDVPDKEEVAGALLDVTKNHQPTEYQLFWFAVMVEDYLLPTKQAGDVLLSLYENDQSTSITKAKVLEIPSKNYGLPDMREEHLKTGHSDWLAWSSAFGVRNQPKGQRNQILKYFRKSSPMNQLIGEFVETCF